MASDYKYQKIVLLCALAFSVCVFIFIGFVIFRYHPTGIEEDGKGNIVLSAAIGDGEIIPMDSIRVITMPEGLMEHITRTNGAAYGSVLYGHFKNTDNRREDLPLPNREVGYRLFHLQWATVRN